MAKPAVLHSSGNWTIQAGDARRTATEMKYLRKTAGYTWTFSNKYRNGK
jgi:hypothetical protein